jgi:hypothetical protein
MISSRSKKQRRQRDVNLYTPAPPKDTPPASKHVLQHLHGAAATIEHVAVHTVEPQKPDTPILEATFG